MGTNMDMVTMTMTVGNLSAIISAIRKLARWRVSTLPTDSGAGPSRQEEVPGGRVPPHKAGQSRFSIRHVLLPFVHLPHRPAKKTEDMAVQDLLQARGQASLTVLLIARLSGLQATVDSKAVQMRARSAAEVLPEAPVAARREVFMVQVVAPVVEVEAEASGAEAEAEDIASGLWLLN